MTRRRPDAVHLAERQRSDAERRCPVCRKVLRDKRVFTQFTQHRCVSGHFVRQNRGDGKR